MTDEVIINTLNENLDLEIKLQDIDRTHRIGEPKKSTGKAHPIIAKFIRNNDRNRVFRNRKN